MKKNQYRNLILPEMPLPHSKIHYKPYFSSLPKKNSKQSAKYIPPFGQLEIHQAENIIEKQGEAEITFKLKQKIGKICEKVSEKLGQQWNLFMNKSEIFSSKNFQWVELQAFLLKIILCFAQETKEIVDELEALKEQKRHDRVPLTSSSNINQTNVCERFNRTQNFDMNSINTSILNQTTMKNASKVTKQPKPTNSKDKNKINELMYQISKLEKEAILFQQKLLENDENHKKKILCLEEEIGKSNSYKYMEVVQQKMKFESEMEIKKSLNETLVREIRDLRERYNIIEKKAIQYEEQLQILKEENENLQKFKRFRELWLMENEEIQLYKEKIHELSNQKETLTKNNNGLKQKLKEISKNFNYNYNVLSENEKNKQDINQILKEFRDWLQFIAVPRVASSMANVNTFFPEMSIPKSSAEEYTTLLPKDDLTNYKLLKPNFFIYFQAFQNVIITEKKFPQRKSMPPDFYLTIRAIMDAMYIHFTFNEDYKSWVNFPQFVSGFLDRFQINFEARKPTLRKIPCHSEEKINFLLNVFNTQAANSWECDTFRSFLLEEFSLDEIYFYLDCRYSLFKGSQVNNNWGACDALTYVKVSVAEDVIFEKLKNYERQMIDKLKKFIRMKKKNKMGKDYIDSNFVLKLLMEVYSIQKVKSQKFFHYNFRLKTQGTKISYAEYHSFMEKNFPFLLSQDIAKLFRETYALALGNITYKTIHFICASKGLFIPLIQEKMLKKSRKPSKQLKQFNDILYIDLQNCISGVNSDIEEFGLEELLGAQLKMNQLLRQSENYRSFKTIYQGYLLKQTQKILKIKTILSWRHTNSIVFDEISRDDLRDFISHLLSIAHHCDHYVAKRRRKKEAKEKALKLLTHNFKIRIQQSLSEFNVENKNKYEEKMKNGELNEMENNQN